MRWGETFRYLILAELSSGYGDENLDRHKVYKKTKEFPHLHTKHFKQCSKISMEGVPRQRRKET